MERFEACEQLKLQNQLCFPLYAASRQIVNLYTPHLKPLGITYTQYLVFLVLGESDGMTVGDIGKKLYLDNGTLSPLLKKLEKEGYIRRERSHEDERIVHIFLTGEGKSFYLSLADIPQKIGGCVSLAGDKAGKLYALLYELLNNIHEE